MYLLMHYAIMGMFKVPLLHYRYAYIHQYVLVVVNV